MATDQEIRDAGFKYIPQQKYLQNPYNLPIAPVPPPASRGITNTNAFTNSGGNGGGGYSGSTNSLINNFNAINQDKYFNSLPTPNVDSLDQSMRDKTFMGMRSYNENQDVNPVDAGEYLASGQDIPTDFSPTMAGRVQETLGKSKDLIGKGAGMAINAALGIPGLSYALGKMDKFNTLPAMDREFINQNKYYTGPTVFGENNSGLGKDPYGINVRSAFGNYGAYVDKMAAGYEDITDEEFEKLSNFQKTKIGFYREKAKQRAIDLEIAQSEAAALNDRATNQGFQKAMAQGDAFYDGLNRGQGATSTSKSRAEAGGGKAANKGEAGSGWENSPFAKGGRAGYFFGGRVNFKNGGLASIL